MHVFLLSSCLHLVVSSTRPSYKKGLANHGAPGPFASQKDTVGSGGASKGGEGRGGKLRGGEECGRYGDGIGSVRAPRGGGAVAVLAVVAVVMV